MNLVLRPLLAAAALLLLAGTVQAASISSVFVNDSTTGDWGDTIAPEPDGSNVGPNFEDDSSVSVPNGWNEWRTQGDKFADSVTGGADNSFSDSHNYHVATQAQNAITTALYYDGSVKYDIAVSALPTATWELTINVSHAGTVTHTDENAGFAEIQSSSSFATVFAPSRSGDTSSTGMASFGGPTSYGSNTNFNDTAGSWNQAGSFVISGTGPQTVAFTLSFEINTDIMGELSFGSGDSMCFNAGHASVGDGPNTNCSVGAGQGLDVSGSLLTTFVPEPGTVVLVGLGLAGLAAMGRRQDV